MKRILTERLLAWKNKKSGRMPLLVYGARQVGKTHILLEFGQQFYKNIAYINLETNQTANSYFNGNIEPERILRFLETEVRQRIIPGDTLIIFDEVQSCERALTSLKYFNEKTPEYHIVCAGSLLGAAIDWLHFAGVILKCERVEHGLRPISVYRDLSAFKLYMSDVGLLTMKSGISKQAILAAGKMDNNFLGAINENYVAQALATKKYGLFYWTSGGTAALDFVLQKDAGIIALEVKTGIRTKSRSLNMFVEKYKPTYSIRISSKNFGFENNMKSVPLYAVFCI